MKKLFLSAMAVVMLFSCGKDSTEVTEVNSTDLSASVSSA